MGPLCVLVDVSGISVLLALNPFSVQMKLGFSRTCSSDVQKDHTDNHAENVKTVCRLTMSTRFLLLLIQNKGDKVGIVYRLTLLLPASDPLTKIMALSLKSTKLSGLCIQRLSSV